MYLNIYRYTVLDNDLGLVSFNVKSISAWHRQESADGQSQPRVTVACIGYFKLTLISGSMKPGFGLMHSLYDLFDVMNIYALQQNGKQFVIYNYLNRPNEIYTYNISMAFPPL